MTNSLLVVGAGPLQVPAFIACRRMGVRSIAVDRNPAAPGMALADAAHAVDTRDVDGIVGVAIREHVKGVMTLCTDAPVKVVAEVGRVLGLRAISPEAAARATDKALMRDALSRAMVPVPAYRRAHSADDLRRAVDELGLPVVLKPPASSGSRGIFKISSFDQLGSAYAHTRSVAGDACDLLVEEFIDGPEVSVETLSFSGRHEIIAITDKRTTGDPHWVETGHVQPSRLPHVSQEAIRKTALAALAAIGVMDAAGHVEIKLAARGARLIELGARLGGDYITTELVPRSTGVDMVEAAVLIALGERPDTLPRTSRGVAIQYLMPPEGLVERVAGLAEARAMPGVARMELDLPEGSAFPGVRSSLDRPGFVIAEGADADEAERRAAAAAARVEFSVRRV